MRRKFVFLLIFLTTLTFIGSCGRNNNSGATNPNNGWTARASGTSDYLFSITWSGTQYVAVGGNNYTSSPPRGTIVTSPDGITWTPSTKDVPGNLNCVVWSGSKFVAVGDGGAILPYPW